MTRASDRERGATRASDRERDAVVQRVQDAFAEGRLDDAEFDERTRAALTADAPVIHVRGIAYKGTVEIVTRSPGRAAPAVG